MSTTRSLIASLLVSVIACGGEVAAPPAPGVPVAAVVVSPERLTVAAGDSGSLSAETRSATGSALAGRAVVWRTTNAAVATVSNGVVAGVSPGSAFVIGSSEGVVDTAVITVTTAAVQASIGIGAGQACASVTAGNAYCWGENTFGEAGNETNGNRQLTARAILGAARFSQLAGGNGWSCGLSTDGRVLCWGSNGSGNLGDGSAGTINRATPQPVSSSLTFTQLSASWSHACAVTPAGSAYCWGFNSDGQIGNSQTMTAFTPQQVVGLPPIDQIAAGTGSTCALTRQRDILCWGRNVRGNLGDGTTVSRITPARIASSVAFTTVVNSGEVACALDVGGQAWCWGAAPRVGDGTEVNRSVPTLVASTERFVQIVASASHVCARTQDNRTFCWGSAFSAVGDGTADRRTAPVAVSGSERFFTIGVGYNASCGVSSNGVFCWGSNGDGEVGDGTRTPRLVPTRVLGLP